VQYEAHSLIHWRRALAIAEASFGAEHEVYGGVLLSYAVVLRQMKRKGEAKEAERRTNAILAKAAGEGSARRGPPATESTRILRELMPGKNPVTAQRGFILVL